MVGDYDPCMSARTHLRAATAAIHRELEQAPVAKQLARGQIEQVTYVDYLRAIAVVVANLRTAIARHGTPELRTLLPTLDNWVSRIDADLDVLAPEDGMANRHAQSVALGLTQQVFSRMRDDPAWVFGVAYVLFGSHNGNLAVSDAVKRGLHLSSSAGTTYLRATQQGSRVWPRFKTLLDRAVAGHGEMEAATRGAVAAFECFRSVFAGLEHTNDRQVKANAINPEAGDHPVPISEDIAQIATEVGRHCHVSFGYLVRRFGSRGEAFARSDGAWLVTLGEIPPTRAEKQIDWLARLLSARGIPSLCLEFHLQALHQALLKANALPRNDPDRLVRLARRVGRTRRTVVGDELWRDMINTPVPALDPLGAAIVSSAIIDQRSGLAPCADSISGWLQTAEGFDSGEKAEMLAVLSSVRLAHA